jgi:ferrous iron transport protein A
MRITFNNVHPKGNVMANINLTDLKTGQFATILSLDIDNKIKHRFSALGLRCGQEIHLLRQGWMHGPLHLRVGMTELMLRRCDARHILISDLGEAA